MRKCPNCKKPVSIGARRCVYCRSLLGDSGESPAPNTQFGMGYSAKSVDVYDYDSNGSTQLGRPSRLDDSSAQSFKSQLNRDANFAPHHTMLGLGPINTSSGRDSDSYDDSTASPQRTIAGMPGISLDSLRPNSSYRVSSQTTQQNTPVPKNNFGSSEFDHIPAQTAQSSSSAAKAAAMQPKPLVVQPEPAKPQAATDAKPDFDPLAGLAGVAPMPSSLVDEEFVDLTSKLFGDNFAEINNNDDDEDEDGLDFDSPAIPAPAPAAAKPAEVNKPSSSAAPSNTADRLTTTKPSSNENKPKSNTNPKKSAAKNSGAADFIACVTAVFTAILFILWIAFAATKKSSVSDSFPAFMAGAAALNILLDLAFFPIRKKIGPLPLAGILFVGVIVAFISIVLTETAVAKAIFLLAMFFQLVTLGTSLFKKS